eukprot:9649715-Alexandrium_andersonii.AAC.1
MELPPSRPHVEVPIRFARAAQHVRSSNQMRGKRSQATSCPRRRSRRARSARRPTRRRAPSARRFARG